MMGYGAMGGFGWTAMLVGSLSWLALLVLVVWAVVRLFPAQRSGEGSTALEILKQRFARGEIDEAEYEQARRLLA